MQSFKPVIIGDTRALLNIGAATLVNHSMSVFFSPKERLKDKPDPRRVSEEYLPAEM